MNVMNVMSSYESYEISYFVQMFYKKKNGYLPSEREERLLRNKTINIMNDVSLLLEFQCLSKFYVSIPPPPLHATGIWKVENDGIQRKIPVSVYMPSNDSSLYSSPNKKKI